MKILYVATISNTINAFLIPHIELLLKQGHQVDIACNVNREIDSKLINRGCKVFDVPFQRSPLKKENYGAYKGVREIIKSGKYDIVHTHTPVASTCVRLACRNIENIKVLYTAHGFHFFKGAPIKNWLLYYPIEKWLSKYTDVLITINQEDCARAKSKFKAKKVKYVPGVGLDTEKFKRVKVDKNVKRDELGVPHDAFVILSVGELNKNKNHETIIKAIAKLENPNIYYVICGVGHLRSYLENLAQELKVNDKVHFLGLRKDIGEICKSSDSFVFPSYREGLSVALMEAMSTGLPVVCSRIRGNVDLIDENGGVLFDPYSIEECKFALQKLLDSDMKTMGRYNADKVKKFDIEPVLKHMHEIYFGE
jgi:glycosyltransferase involved in cell wall biosynthesis